VAWRYGEGYAAWCPLGPRGYVYEQPRQWVVVQQNRFLQPVRVNVVPVYQRRQVFVAPVWRGPRSGPEPVVVARVTGQPVRPLVITDHGARHTQVNGGTISFYRPRTAPIATPVQRQPVYTQPVDRRPPGYYTPQPQRPQPVMTQPAERRPPEVFTQPAERRPAEVYPSPDRRPPSVVTEPGERRPSGYYDLNRPPAVQAGSQQRPPSVSTAPDHRVQRQPQPQPRPVQQQRPPVVKPVEKPSNSEHAPEVQRQ
jgi:hypothetical protein